MTKIDVDQIAKDITKQIESFKLPKKAINIGIVKEIGDGVAIISGLSDACLGEILEFPKKTLALALNLKKENVGALILDSYEHIKEGDEVKRTGKILQIDVGVKMLGRVIDPLGNPLDGLGNIGGDKKNMLLEKIAPGVIERKSVDTPLSTGIKAIDSMIPIGRGQRELIIGDRGTGKTAIVIDTIINQRFKSKDQKPVYCIYVSIGQKQSKLAQVVGKLKETGSLDYTIIVAANASIPCSLCGMCYWRIFYGKRRGCFSYLR